MLYLPMIDSSSSHNCHDANRRLPILGRVGVGVLLTLGIVRAAIFLVYATIEIPAADQPFILEGVNVHFASCVQHGEPLYPIGNGPAYTVNYTGPCYFWLVGMIGRWLNADIAALFTIGRIATLTATLGMAALAAFFLKPRYGRWAALAGFVFTLGAAPMVVFGVMARPDMMANLVGAAGFFVACRLRPRWLWLAAVLLAIALLTKQTMFVWPTAALGALVFEKAWRRAVLLGIATVSLTVAIVVATASFESNLVPSLLGQTGVAFDWQQCRHIFRLMRFCSPEMFFFLPVGCILWGYGRNKDIGLLTLAIVGLAVSTLTCAKHGSDINYFIPLCLVESLAVGTMCVAASRSDCRSILLVAAVWIGAIATTFGTQYAAAMMLDAVDRRTSEVKLAKQKEFQHYVQLAESPDTQLFTDSDRLAVFQGQRAAFFDAYLFRLQVEAGKLQPRELVKRLQSRSFQYVILSANIATEYHDPVSKRLFFYRMPDEIVAAIRANYKLQSREAGMFVYVPR